MCILQISWGWLTLWWGFSINRNQFAWIVRNSYVFCGSRREWISESGGIILYKMTLHGKDISQLRTVRAQQACLRQTKQRGHFSGETMGMNYSHLVPSHTVFLKPFIESLEGAVQATMEGNKQLVPSHIHQGEVKLPEALSFQDA